MPNYNINENLNKLRRRRSLSDTIGINTVNNANIKYLSEARKNQEQLDNAVIQQHQNDREAVLLENEQIVRDRLNAANAWGAALSTSGNLVGVPIESEALRKARQLYNGYRLQ